MTRLKVLSYNIHKGLSAGNLKFVLRKIRQRLHELQPDLVCLQEVLGKHTRHKKHFPDKPDISQFEYLAEDLWPHYHYGKNAVYSQGHHGNAILSRFPITFAENMDISTNSIEKRGLLHAILSVPGKARKSRSLHVICAHLGLFENSRKVQVSRLCQRITTMVPMSEPLIVAGDFNDWREQVSPVLEEALHLQEVHKSLHGAHARSFPSWLPFLQLDRVYVRGLNSLEARCLTGPPWNQLSDHSALFVVVE